MSLYFEVEFGNLHRQKLGGLILSTHYLLILVVKSKENKGATESLALSNLGKVWDLMESIWNLKKEIHTSAMNISAKVYLHGFQICCHSAAPSKITPLISPNKIDPTKEGSK